MERWYWIELIGFDNEAEDLGVGAFLSRNVSTTGISLLFSHIDFLFEKNEYLSPRACSYFGHEYNRERRRQSWTKAQLKRLVDILHSHGVKVFFSSFDMTSDIKDPAWLCFNSAGTAEKLVYVLKRIDDSTTVGDIIIERIREALSFYGFDGLQLADGLSSNRLSIENGDFSLSLCKDFPCNIPARLMREDTESYIARRKWILKNAKYEWIKYISDGWASFYKALFDRIDKPIMFNIAWTRDSFEALYRYGLDYTRCEADRAYAIMIEENSATRAITAKEDEAGVELTCADRRGFTYEYAQMQQNIRLVTAGARQIALTPISDTMEQWDAIRHCPTELSRAIVRRYNNFVYRNGAFEACSDAPLYCLSDAVPESDWKWLAKQESYRVPTPDFIDGFVAVCNPAAIHSDVARFSEKKHYYGSALLGELLLGGLNIGAQTALDELESFDRARCLVVTDLVLYSDEQKDLLTKVRLPLLVIGEDVELPLQCSARYNGKYVSAALYNTDITPSFDLLAGFEKTLRVKKSKHGEIWTEPLAYKRVDGRFFEQLSLLLTEEFGLDRCEVPDVIITSLLSGGAKYIILSNNKYTYNIAKVTVEKSFTEADALMKECGYRVKHTDNSFSVRIPPRGIEIVKIV